MIVIVTGLAGSGKTDTCYAVIARNYFARLVFLESEWLCAKVPFDWNNRNDIESVYQMLALLIDYHVNRGEENFIITLGLPLLKYYAEFRGYLHKSCPVMLFCLKCNKDEVLRRIHERGRNAEQMQREIDALEGDYEYLNKFIHDNSFAREIENTKINEDEVAAKIIDIIRMDE